MAHFTTSDGVRIYFEEHGTGRARSCSPTASAAMRACGSPISSPLRPAPAHPLGAARARALGEPRGPGQGHLRPLGARPPRPPRPPRARARGGGRPLARRRASPPASRSAHPERVRALVVVDSSSAAGLPLGVDNLVMRAKSIEVTLKGGMDAMAEFAIASNPNVAGRLKLDPSAREEIFDYYRMLTPIGYANALRALLQMDYITDRLPRSRRRRCSSAATRIPRSGPCG